MTRPKIKQRDTGKRLQAELERKDALDQRHVPQGMMGSAWGYNRPKRPSVLDSLKAAFGVARERAQRKRNPPPQIEGALDISDLYPRRKPTDA